MWRLKNRFTPSGTRLYRIWGNMKTRCYNPNCKEYDRYGGRGIKICSEWIDDFATFENWAYANGYREYLSIDRINNDKGYDPDNCRWADQHTQTRNTSKVNFIEIEGEVKTLAEWAESSGVPYSAVKSRYYKYGDRGKSLIRPLRNRNA